MFTPAPPGKNDALQDTQQQLDELETLIQRMLTLPVNQRGEEAPAELPPMPPLPELAESSEAQGESIERDAAFGARLEPLASVASIELPEASPAPLVSRFDFLETTALDVPDRGKTVKEETPAEPSPAPPSTLTVAAVQPPRPVIIEKHQPPAPRIDWWLWLLVKVNRLFDRSTCHLGAPGRRLRSEGGRAFLGWLGALMLTGGLVWALLDWIRRRW